MDWKGCSLNNPYEWGWHLIEGMILTNQPAGPSQLLDVMYCNCKKDCNTRRCTCKKYGLHCSNVCGACQGVSCSNAQLPELLEDYDE